MPADVSAAEQRAEPDLLSELPEPWRPGQGATLDLEGELRGAARPPLAYSDSRFDLIWVGDALTRGWSEWAEWLIEIGRLLSPGGVAVCQLALPREFERLSGETWEEDRIGISVMRDPEADGWRAFHSEWWLRAHWGRAFEVSEVLPHGGRRILLRRRGAGITPDELRAPEPDESREAVSMHAELGRLLAGWERADRLHRHELQDQREEFGRELMRRAFDAADSGWSSGVASPAAVMAARYEATLSWRVTRPLRAAGRLARRFR